MTKPWSWLREKKNYLRFENWILDICKRKPFNHLHPRTLFGENIFKFRNCIFAFSLLSLLEKGCGPSFEQTSIPFTHRCFLLSLADIGPVVLKEKILNFVNFITPFCNYLPLEKDVALHLNKLEFPSTIRCFVPRGLVVEISPVYDNDDDYSDHADNGLISIRKAHLKLRLMLSYKANLAENNNHIKLQLNFKNFKFKNLTLKCCLSLLNMVLGIFRLSDIQPFWWLPNQWNPTKYTKTNCY